MQEPKNTGEDARPKTRLYRRWKNPNPTMNRKMDSRDSACTGRKAKYRIDGCELHQEGYVARVGCDLG